jgi:UDP-glucose 4-epimerase
MFGPANCSMESMQRLSLDDWPVNRRYSGMPVLITGGLGFLGTNLVISLVRSGARVRVLASPRAYAYRMQSGLLGLLDGLECHVGSTSDVRLLEAAVDGCAVVFNLAGRSDVAGCSSEPIEDLETNMRSQLLLLDACRRRAPDATVVFSSSRLVYGPTDHLPVAESTPPDPGSIYAVHKLLAERYHLLFRRLHGLRTTMLRLTNVYGPLEPAYRPAAGVLNVFLRRAAAGHDLTVYGDGSQLRDCVHVLDVTSAFLMAGTAGEGDGTVLNVGSGQGVSLMGLATTIGGLADVAVRSVPWPHDARAIEPGSFVADARRIEEVLGWRATVGLGDGLAATLRWYRSLPVGR